jgi:hypothetical protein
MGMYSGNPERRQAQRFILSLPVAVRSPEDAFREETAVSHDVSSRGIFFFMTGRPVEGARIEFVVTLPPEVTLTDSMRVNCKGAVVRVAANHGGRSYGVGATIEGYNSFIRLSTRTDILSHA